MEPLQIKDYLFLNNLPIISEINNLKLEVDAYRPLDKETEARIMQKFRLDWNYNSNAIEGNSLDYGETLAFLMHGVTAKGKPLKDYLDIKGHNEAINFLQDIVKNKDELRESDIRALHKMLLVEPYKTPSQTVEGIAIQKTVRLGEYKRTPNHVLTITGETHYYAMPEDTPMLMTELVDWYRTSIAESTIHPIIIAAVLHHRFTSIHPFDDGNGRMSRLLMNLILMQYFYPPVVIKNSDKKEYYLTLSQADAGDIEPFISFIGSNMLNSLNIYVKGAKGESVEEPSDLGKKLTLFKKEVEARRDRVEAKKSFELQTEIINNSITPFLNAVTITLSDFKDLFLGYEEYNIHPTNSERDFWNYTNRSIKGTVELYCGESYYTSNDSEFIVCTQLLRFKVINNPFSVELKILVEFKELSYEVSYSISEVNELKRIKARKYLYTQWLEKNLVHKYYHQFLTQEEIDKSVSTIGESLLDYIRLAYEENSSFVTELTYEDAINLFKGYLNGDPDVEKATVNIIRDIGQLIFSREEQVIRIQLPATNFRDISESDRSKVEQNFYEIVNGHSKSLTKVFVYLTAR